MIVSAQITISAEQLKDIKNWVEIVVWPSLPFIGHRLMLVMKTRLNEVMTDNVNRIKDELISHIDRKFDVHEKDVSLRMGKIDNRMDVMDVRFNEMRKQLDTMNKLLTDYIKKG